MYQNFPILLDSPTIIDLLYSGLEFIRIFELQNKNLARFLFNLFCEMANEFIEFINALIEQSIKLKRPYNILVIGDQHDGKSSLINTVSRVFHPTDNLIHHEPAPAGDMQYSRITHILHRIELVESKIYIFDTPGRNYQNETQKKMLQLIVNGLKEDTVLFDPKTTDDVLLQNLQKNVDVENKIDVIVLVINPKNVLDKTSGWVFTSYEINNESMQEYLEFIGYLIILSSGKYPYVVFTCKDKHADYQKATDNFAAKIIPKSQLFFIKNYIDRRETKIEDTDLQMYNLKKKINTKNKKKK